MYVVATSIWPNGLSLGPGVDALAYSYELVVSDGTTKMYGLVIYHQKTASPAEKVLRHFGEKNCGSLFIMRIVRIQEAFLF